MSKIATLGPKGTYSEAATLKYIASCDESHEVIYFSTIKKALDSVGKVSDIAVLPIENFSEGYVSLVLDHIIGSELKIISEILLPIQFSFVSDMTDIREVKRLFVQFFAKGQCSEYIDKLSGVEIISTESNIESRNMLMHDAVNSGAIVPSGSYDLGAFNTVVDNVNDYKNNQTRFLAFSSQVQKIDMSIVSNWKTTLVIFDDNDRPGLLFDILASFSSRNINLTSIISRPTRVEFGKYNFLIDIKGHSEDPLLSAAINEVSLIARVKNMGSYLSAESL